MCDPCLLAAREAKTLLRIFIVDTCLLAWQVRVLVASSSC